MKNALASTAADMSHVSCHSSMLLFASLTFRSTRRFHHRTAVIKIGVAALNRFIRDNVGHEHSGVEGNDIRAWRNAFCAESPLLAVIMDTAAGFPFLGNQQQGPAPVAHHAVPHWHAAIMLRRLAHVERVLDKSPYQSSTPKKPVGCNTVHLDNALHFQPKQYSLGSTRSQAGRHQ